MNIISNVLNRVLPATNIFNNFKHRGDVKMDFQSFINRKTEVARALKRFCLNIIQEKKIEIEEPEFNLIIIPKDTYEYRWRIDKTDIEGDFFFNFRHLNELFAYWTGCSYIPIAPTELYLKYYIASMLEFKIREHATKIKMISKIEPEKIILPNHLMGTIGKLKFRSVVFEYVDEQLKSLIPKGK